MKTKKQVMTAPILKKGGSHQDIQEHTCPICHGDGAYKVTQYNSAEDNVAGFSWMDCEYCGGTGVIMK